MNEHISSGCREESAGGAALAMNLRSMSSMISAHCATRCEQSIDFSCISVHQLHHHYSTAPSADPLVRHGRKRRT
jgi:hypothetical protein